MGTAQFFACSALRGLGCATSVPPSSSSRRSCHDHSMMIYLGSDYELCETLLNHDQLDHTQSFACQTQSRSFLDAPTSVGSPSTFQSSSCLGLYPATSVSADSHGASCYHVWTRSYVPPEDPCTVPCSALLSASNHCSVCPAMNPSDSGTVAGQDYACHLATSALWEPLE